MIVGIDYGSKMAGTTVIAYEEKGEVKLMASKKNQDADRMILDFVDAFQPRLIGLDAPLSLPGVYTQPKEYQDYFYRQCDKELKAMSPMFLGGLTARAMKLKAQLNKRVELIEVYPGMTARNLNLADFNYKKKEVQYGEMINRLSPYLESTVSLELKDSHSFDALLALKAAKAYAQGKAEGAGNPKEGLIYY